MTGPQIKSGLAVDADAIDTIRRGYQQAPEIVDRWVRKDIVPWVRHQVDLGLRRPPGPVVYPIQWKSEKQRRFVMMLLTRRAKAEGRYPDISYQRTGQILKGWSVKANYEKGFTAIMIAHESRVAMFVYGVWQQPFHKNTGWPYMPDFLQVLSVNLSERIYDGWPSVAAQVMNGGK